MKNKRSGCCALSPGTQHSTLSTNAMDKTFYVTTPIYYTNSAPHIGHAYTTLVADTLARFHRQRGSDAFFLTGTDEHGINIERAADARGVPYKEYVDQIFEAFQTAFAPLGVEYNRW